MPWKVAISPGCVTSGASTGIDRPKSPTFTVPSGSTKQFDGFTSRWRMPQASAASRPATTCRIASTAAGGAIGPSRSTTSFSVPPATSSIAMTGLPLISSLPKTKTVFG